MAWTSVPVTQLKELLTCEDHGGSYSLCLLLETDGSLVGAVPVARDLDNGKVLLAISANSAVRVPAAPTGEPAEAMVEMLDEYDAFSNEKVLFCVIDQAFVDAQRLRQLREDGGGQVEENYLLFGPDGDCCPVSSELVDAARRLKFLAEDDDGEAGYLSAASMPPSLRMPKGVSVARGMASRVPRGAGRGAKPGAGRGKMTVAGLAEQLTEALDRIAAQDKRIRGLQDQALEGDPFDALDDSLAFGGAAAGSSADLGSLKRMAGAPPGSRQLGAAFSKVEPLNVASARAPPPRKSGASTPAEVTPRLPAQKPTSKAPAPPSRKVPAAEAGDPDLRQAMAAMMQTQKLIMERFAAMEEKKPGGPLTDLATSGADDIAGIKLPGARGAAALELYRADLESRPQAWSQKIRSNAVKAVGITPALKGEDIGMQGFLLRFMPWGKAGKGVTYLGFLIAQALDLFEAGQWHMGEALLYLGLTALEQSLHDAGRWGFAWLLTHQPEPPWHLLQSGPQPDGMRPFGRLAEAGWTAAAMAFARDAASLAELRKKGATPDPKAGDPKAGGKGG